MRCLTASPSCAKEGNTASHVYVFPSSQCSLSIYNDSIKCFRRVFAQETHLFKTTISSLVAFDTEEGYLAHPL